MSSEPSEQPRRLYLARLLQFQQELLAFEPAGVSGEPAVLSDDAMARHDDAQRIATDCLADLPGRGAVVKRRGKFPICQGLAVRDCAQKVPDTLLGFVAVQPGWQVESVPPAGQVVGELSLSVGQ